VSQGAKLRAFPQDMMNAAFKNSQAIYDETSSKNESFKKIYADLVKFRADQNLWFRFTEATFDRFMQTRSCKPRPSSPRGGDPPASPKAARRAAFSFVRALRG
jgi:hypothetical protein